jgi:hypothetical protein
LPCRCFECGDVWTCRSRCGGWCSMLLFMKPFFCPTSPVQLHSQKTCFRKHNWHGRYHRLALQLQCQHFILREELRFLSQQQLVFPCRIQRVFHPFCSLKLFGLYLELKATSSGTPLYVFQAAVRFQRKALNPQTMKVLISEGYPLVLFQTRTTCPIG